MIFNRLEIYVYPDRPGSDQMEVVRVLVNDIDVHSSDGQVFIAVQSGNRDHAVIAACDDDCPVRLLPDCMEISGVLRDRRTCHGKWVLRFGE